MQILKKIAKQIKKFLIFFSDAWVPDFYIRPRKEPWRHTKSDEENLADDWKKVGGYLRTATEKFKKENDL